MRTFLLVFMRVLLAAALFFSLAVFYGYPPLKMDGRPNLKCGRLAFFFDILICVFATLQSRHFGIFILMCFHFSSLNAPCYWQAHTRLSIYELFIDNKYG